MKDIQYKEWLLTDYIIKTYVGGIKLAQDKKFRNDVRKSFRYKLYQIKNCLTKYL